MSWVVSPSAQLPLLALTEMSVTTGGWPPKLLLMSEAR